MKIVWAEPVFFVLYPGAPEFMRSHGIEVIDTENEECIQFMGKFIRDHPQLWNEVLHFSDAPSHERMLIFCAIVSCSGQDIGEKALAT